MNKKEANLLKDLKLAVESPKRYLATYFDELKNQIDLECQSYLGRDKLADEDKEKAISQQLNMIQEVNFFEKKCLENVLHLELPTKEQIEGIEEEKELYITLYQVQKQMFMNQGMFFFGKGRFDEFLSNFCVNLHCINRSELIRKYSEHNFLCVLFFIEDEFMILNEKVELMLSKREIRNDWCNESLRFLILCKELVNCRPSHYYQISLKMNEQDEFYFKEVHFNTELLKLDLPSLEKIYIIRCKLTRIDKNFFSDLPNLEELYLSQNIFVELDKDLFKNLTALKELKVNNNKIPKLDPGIFSEFLNLISLELRGNELIELDKDIFKNLRALKQLYLSNNKITKLEPGIFSDLPNLEELCLSHNELVELEKDLFKDLTALKILSLRDNKIAKLGPGIFSELPNLEELDLSDNELIELDKDIFRNLSALDYLGLNGNKINWSCILPFLPTRQRSI